MLRKLVVSAGCAALAAGLLAGCGTANNTTNTSNTAVSTSKSTTTVVRTGNNSMVVAPKTEVGTANMKHLMQIADKNPSNFEAQMNAADSASVNGNVQAAIQYFKRAAQINPKSGLAWTALGNMYRERENQPKAAIPYYQKSIQMDPSYGWAYWQLAQAYVTLKETSLAKQVVEQGLKNVKKTDTAYASLQLMMSELSGKSSGSK